jgi:hypothetical protein
MLQKPRKDRACDAALPQNVLAAHGCGDARSKLKSLSLQGDPIRATLAGFDAATALGLSVQCGSPILILCRSLIEAGADPATPLEAYRGSILCLRIRSIGEAAGLEIRGDGVGFRPSSKLGAAPPMRANGASRYPAARPPHTSGAAS